MKTLEEERRNRDRMLRSENDNAARKPLASEASEASEALLAQDAQTWREPLAGVRELSQGTMTA